MVQKLLAKPLGHSKGTALCIALPRTVCKEAVSGDREGWLLPSSGKPEAIESVHPKSHFKMEGINMLKDLILEGTEWLQ